MRFSLMAAASGLALLLPAAAAAEPAEVLPVTVITRLPVTTTEAVDVVTIDRREIELRQAVTPREVLNTVPGLAVERSGAFGGLIAVRQRGAPTDKSLILLDGAPLNDISQPNGSTDLGQIDMGDIARVEVMSGPLSALWGSDAIGGVIAFTTDRSPGWRAALEGGSHGFTRGSASLNAASGPLSGGLSASGWRADGISAADARDGNTERDGGWSYTLAGHGRIALSDDAALFAEARYLRARSDTDGFPAPAFTLADTEEFAANRTLYGRVGADVRALGLSHQASYAVYAIDRANLGGDFPSAFEGRRQVARYTAGYGGPADSFSLQGGVEHDQARASLSDGIHLSVSDASIFLVARLRPVEPLTLTGSVRYDDPSDIGGVATGRLSAVWRLGGGFELTGALGQGFKAPTISQLACDFCFPPGPSTGLRPEHADGYEAGLVWRGDGGASARVTLFRLDIRDMIDFSASFPFRYVNLARVRSQGLEAEARIPLGDRLAVRGAYAFTDAVDRATGQAQLRVPRHAGSASLLYAGRRLSGELEIRAEGPQTDTGFARRPGFVVANLFGQYALTDHIQLTARIENLTDRHYQEVLGYGEPGLSAYVGVRVRGN
jgi:vitamin B12 transporter